jgi:hypothetical protein
LGSGCRDAERARAGARRGMTRTHAAASAGGTRPGLLVSEATARRPDVVADVTTRLTSRGAGWRVDPGNRRTGHRGLCVRFSGRSAVACDPAEVAGQGARNGHANGRSTVHAVVHPGPSSGAVRHVHRPARLTDLHDRTLVQIQNRLEPAYRWRLRRPRSGGSRRASRGARHSLCRRHQFTEHRLAGRASRWHRSRRGVGPTTRRGHQHERPCRPNEHGRRTIAGGPRLLDNSAVSTSARLSLLPCGAAGTRSGGYSAAPHRGFPHGVPCRGGES